jgi:hypothetical protein
MDMAIMKRMLLFVIVLGLIISANSAIAECLCPEGSNPLVFLKGRNNENSLIVCGYLVERKNSNHAIATEFEVFQCGEKEPLLTFYELHNYSVKTVNSKLVITELIIWPFGQNWKSIEIPYQQTIIKMNPYFVMENKIILEPPELKKETIDKGLKYYESFRNKKDMNLENEEKLVGIIFTIALTGNKRAQKYFGQLWKEIFLDGYSAERYHEAITIYNCYSRATGKVPYINVMIFGYTEPPHEPGNSAALHCHPVMRGVI